MEMCYDGTLVMPSSYAVMSEEEMTYVEGGKFYGVNLSAKQCENVAIFLGGLGISFTVTAVICSVIGFIPGLQIVLTMAKIFGALSTASTISYILFDYCGRHNGMRIGFESSTKEFIFSIN